MYQEKKLLYLHCETPLHAGSGSDLGIVDLPIQRERTTGFPKIEASSLKGAVREHFFRSENEEGRKMIGRIFGPAPDAVDANKTAGCITFTDASLLAMPIRSAAGVFAYATCPGLLRRWYRDAGLDTQGIPTVEKNEALVINDTNLIPDGTSVIVLEEFTFETEKQDVLDPIYDLAKLMFPNDSLMDKLLGDLVILNDEDFSYFAENATEVVTRIRISQETGTVDQGALWTEEYLPMESILYSVVLASGEFVTNKKPNRLSAESVMGYINDHLSKAPRFQLGGNATLGKGHLKTTMSGANQNSNSHE
jgi:CRISPR-associated protein Cmr4